MVSFKPVKQVVDWLRRIRTSQPETQDNPAPVVKPRDFYQHATSCLERRDLDGAINSLQKAIAQFPNYVPGYVRLAELLERNHRFEEAEAIATKGLEKDPNEFQRRKLLETRGFARVQQGDLAGGSADLQVVVDTSDRQPSFYDAANRLASLQQFDLALRLLRENQPFLWERNSNILRFSRLIHLIQSTQQTWNDDVQRVQQNDQLHLRKLDKQPIFELAVYPGDRFPPSQYCKVPVCYKFPVEPCQTLDPEFDELDGLLAEEKSVLVEENSKTLYQQRSQSIITLPDAVVVTVGDEQQFVVSEQGFYYDRERPQGIKGIGYTVFYPVMQTLDMGYFLTLRTTENHYHSIIDVVSSLVQYPLEKLDCPLLVFAEQLELTRKLAGGAGIHRERVQPMTPEMGILVKTGLVATGEQDLDCRLGEIGRQIGQNLLKEAGLEPGEAERVYISRRSNPKRPLKNERVVEAILGDLGFQIVLMEEESFERQIAIVRGAKVVVAPHGAGLTNLLFAPAGTTVIELFPKAYPSPLFWELSHLCGHRYYPLVGEMTDTADLARQETFEWEVDCDRLRELLRRVLGI